MHERQERSHEDVLDEVYLQYAHSDPFLPITHFIDHVTMGAEALVELGLGDRVKEWTAHHRVRPYNAPCTGTAISSDWQKALGRRECHGDFIKHFDAELVTRPFADVLAEWVPRFAHDSGAFLFHGVIRTGHATRALEHRDTPARRGELSRGLALWAIGVRDAPVSATGNAEALAPNGDNLKEILDHARHGAATFIDTPNVPNLHFVTGPMAYLLIARYLDDKTHGIAKTSFDKTHHDATQRFPLLKQNAYDVPTSVVDQKRRDALASTWDAHPAKLTEAALRAHVQSGDEIFLKTAGKALDIHGLRGLLGIVKGLLRRHFKHPAEQRA